MANTYTTTQDYIEQNITPGIGVELTEDQALEVTHRMTEWDNGQLVEREGVDFWDVVADVLGAK